MPGTELAYSATRWYKMRGAARAYRAMVRGTELAYAGVQHHWRSFQTRLPVSLRACYAMSGTELAYGALRCP
eukprot:105205-Rhodomonas_salina.1